MDQIPYSEGLRHCCPPDHISHIMVYAIYLEITRVDHLVAKEKKVDPATET
jgi:hypothetical protein